MGFKRSQTQTARQETIGSIGYERREGHFASKISSVKMESIDELAARRYPNINGGSSSQWANGADIDAIENRGGFHHEHISTDNDRIFSGLGSSNHIMKTEQSFEADLAYFPGSPGGEEVPDVVNDHYDEEDELLAESRE